MKGTKNFFTLLIFSIAVAFTGGCSSPIGSLQDSLDYIRVEPRRFVYAPIESFIPKEDVDVYGVFGGGEEKLIAIEEVKIIISDLSWGDGITLDESEKENGLPLIALNAGVKNVFISYSGRETFYRISVGEAETGDGGGGSSGGTGITIGLDWPD
jgi:hypothetical protein